MSAEEKYDLLSDAICEACFSSNEFKDWERQDYEKLCNYLLDVVNK